MFEILFTLVANSLGLLGALFGTSSFAGVAA